MGPRGWASGGRSPWRGPSAALCGLAPHRSPGRPSPLRLGASLELSEEAGGEKALPGAEARALPASVWRILGTEFGERFSYYSLRAVLTLYFLSIGFSEGEAVTLCAYTSALAYLMPLFGGVIADVWWGRYRTILVFALIYITGSAALALNAAAGGGATGALAALVLISVGTGGIKPCVSAFGADQLPEGDELARSRYFASFYLAINCGSILSFVVAPLLRNIFGFPAAFAAATVVLCAATAAFASGRDGYRQSQPAGSFYRDVASYLGQQIARALCRRKYDPLGAERSDAGTVLGKRLGEETAIQSAVGRTPPEATQVEAALAALRPLLPVLLLMPCFWALFEQQGSAWILQAKAMRRDGLLPFGWEVSPEMLLIFNPIFVTLLVPSMTRLFEMWPRLFSGRHAPSPTQKMTCGMLIGALAFLCSSAVQSQLDIAEVSSVPVLWQLPQIFLITLAEVLVSVVSLEYFYSQAPAEGKAAVSALSCLTVSVGAVLCGLLYQVLSPFLGTAKLLLAFAGLMALNATAFFFVTGSHRATFSE